MIINNNSSCIKIDEVHHCIPAKLGHGIGKAEHAGADHGGDHVECGVPPLGVPPRVDAKQVDSSLLLVLGAPAILHVIGFLPLVAAVAEPEAFRSLDDSYYTKNI